MARPSLKRYALLSIVAALATIALKGVAWWLTGSVGLLSDAAESLVNLAGALMALAMLTLAEQPADDNHAFGHGKAEYFSSAFEGFLIVVAAVAISYSAVDRLIHPRPLEALGLGLGFSAVASVINYLTARVLMTVGRQHHSITLEADAHHLMTDVWTSVGVVAGLLFVPLTGWLWLDPLLAVGVALNILREGGRLVWRSVDGLMDSAVDPKVQVRIDAVLALFKHHAIRFDHLGTRRAGQRLFVELHMHMPAHWTLGRAAALRTDVEQALMDEVPGLRASIQLLPLDVEAQSAAAAAPPR